MPPKRKKATSGDDEPRKKAQPAKGKSQPATRGKKATAAPVDDGGDGKTSAKKRGKKKKSSESGDEEGEPVEKEDSTIPWQSAAYRSMTDQILTEVEENDAMRCALGFDPFGVATVRGLKQADYHRMLAKKVVLAHPDFAHWTLERATLAVKNRLDKLKKTFGTYKNQLNDTGEGLPFDEESGKLPDEHPHQNLYEKILSDFPWYYRVRNLLVKSPIYDRSAVANSATPLDFSFLAGKATSPEAPPGAVPSNTPSIRATSISDGSDSSSSSDEDVPKTTRAPKGSAAAKASQGDAVIRPAAGKKKLSQIETLNATLERDSKQRQAFVADALKSKHALAERKAERKEELQVKMLQMKLDARAKREQEQREHEYRMAQIRLGIPASSTAPHPTSTHLGSLASLPPLPSTMSSPTPSFDFSAASSSSFPLHDLPFTATSTSGSSTPSTSYSSLGDDIRFPTPPPPEHY